MVRGVSWKLSELSALPSLSDLLSARIRSERYGRQKVRGFQGEKESAMSLRVSFDVRGTAGYAIEVSGMLFQDADCEIATRKSALARMSESR